MIEIVLYSIFLFLFTTISSSQSNGSHKITSISYHLKSLSLFNVLVYLHPKFVYTTGKPSNCGTLLWTLQQLQANLWLSNALASSGWCITDGEALRRLCLSILPQIPFTQRNCLRLGKILKFNIANLFAISMTISLSTLFGKLFTNFKSNELTVDLFITKSSSCWKERVNAVRC